MLTELCEIAFKYGTDKCPQFKHSYTPFYYELFKDRRNEVKKVLEMGIGNYPDMKHVNRVYDPALGRMYERGASLKMWREFFPNATIYGADILPETLFEEDRIKTFLCDEASEDDVTRLIESTGSDIDLFVDDGSHACQDQIRLALTALPLLDASVTYIIEDVRKDRIYNVLKRLSDYDCTVPDINSKYKDGNLIVVRKK